MKHKLKIAVVVLTAVLNLTPTVRAVPITGTLTIQGTTKLTLQGSSGAALGTADGVAANTGAVVSGSGSFASVTAGTLVTFSAFTFNPVTVPVLPLWVLASPFQDYKFDLTGMTVNTYNASVLDISGTGTLTIGVDSTAGTWTYHVTSATSSADFSYQSTNTALVPDGGITVMLLGVALSGLYCFRKKISA